MCVSVCSGLLCEGHRHLDGSVPPLRLLCFARIRCCQLRVQATQGAAAIQTSSQEQEQGTEALADRAETS